jgi:hypothetical protein
MYIRNLLIIALISMTIGFLTGYIAVVNELIKF